jgi:hypothetical protein
MLGPHSDALNSTTEHCPAVRPCPRGGDASGVILLSLHGQATAGLHDRAYLLSSTAALAAALCARVHVPRPCLLLSPGHNHPSYAPVPCTLEWSRYFELRSADDGSNLLAGRGGAKLPTCSAPHCAFINGSSPKDHIRNHNPGAVVVSAQVRSEYEQARAALQRNGTFHWQLDHYFYDWYRSPLARQLELLLASAADSLYGSAQTKHDRTQTACPPRATYGFSRPVLQAVSRFEAAIPAPLASSFALHVRRGGETRLCDTSAAAIARYLACARAPREDEHALSSGFPRGERFLLFTDETDNAYIHDLVTALRELAGDGGGALHGDPIIASGATDDFNRTGGWDNYFVVQVVHAIFERVTSGVRLGYLGACFQANMSDEQRCSVPMRLHNGARRR